MQTYIIFRMQNKLTCHIIRDIDWEFRNLSFIETLTKPLKYMNIAFMNSMKYYMDKYDCYKLLKISKIQ